MKHYHSCTQTNMHAAKSKIAKKKKTLIVYVEKLGSGNVGRPWELNAKWSNEVQRSSIAWPDPPIWSSKGHQHLALMFFFLSSFFSFPFLCLTTHCGNKWASSLIFIFFFLNWVLRKPHNEKDGFCFTHPSFEISCTFSLYSLERERESVCVA